MPEDLDFQQRMARIAGLTRQLEQNSEAKELLQAVMDLHAVALDRLLEIVYDNAGKDVIDALGSDPLTGSLMILYGLHPQETETRVAKAIEEAAASFQQYNARLELLEVEGTVVRLKVHGSLSSAAGKHLKGLVEEKIYALAPDVTRVEGLASLGSELVGIELLPAGASA